MNIHRKVGSTLLINYFKNNVQTAATKKLLNFSNEFFLTSKKCDFSEKVKSIGLKILSDLLRALLKRLRKFDNISSIDFI